MSTLVEQKFENIKTELKSVVEAILPRERISRNAEAVAAAVAIAALLIVGGSVVYYSEQERKIDYVVEHLLASDQEDNMVSLYVVGNYCRTEIPSGVQKVITKYVARRGADFQRRASAKREELTGNVFAAGLMSMIGCPVVQNVVNSYSEELNRL